MGTARSFARDDVTWSMAVEDATKNVSNLSLIDRMNATSVLRLLRMEMDQPMGFHAVPVIVYPAVREYLTRFQIRLLECKRRNGSDRAQDCIVVV